MSNWTARDCSLNIFGMIIWILFGTFALYVHNNLLPVIYIIFAVGVVIAHSYFYCARCFYYGKTCYIYGGILSKKLFKGRHEGPMDPDDAITASLWFLVAMFPVPFLLYYQDNLLIVIYTAIFLGWFYIHNNTACPKCDNRWCRLNKKGGK